MSLFDIRRPLGSFNTPRAIKASQNPRIAIANAKGVTQTGIGAIYGAAMLQTVASVI